MEMRPRRLTTFALDPEVKDLLILMAARRAEKSRRQVTMTSVMEDAIRRLARREGLLPKEQKTK